jgi:hypothetical protein
LLALLLDLLAVLVQKNKYWRTSCWRSGLVALRSTGERSCSRFYYSIYLLY